MSHNYRESDEECQGCGSSFEDRQKRRDENPEDDIPTGLSECIYCGTDKCCMCDMGDDVNCGSCPNDDDED